MLKMRPFDHTNILFSLLVYAYANM